MMTFSTSPSPLLASLKGRTWQAEAQVRFENVKTLDQNFFKSMTQDTNTFKLGSALMASFTLVMARIYITTRSAQKEALTTGSDSESTAFCKEQALMTTVRELGGFLTSWLFMALFNVAMDKPSQLLLGVRVNKHGVTGPVSVVSKLVQQLIPFGNRVQEEALPHAVGCKQTLHILGMPATFDSINPSSTEAYFSTLKPNKLQVFFRKGLELLVNQPQLKQELAVEALHKNLTGTLHPDEKAALLLQADAPTIQTAIRQLDPESYQAALIQRGFDNFRTYVVPIMGAIISTVVAGWMLERVTLIHFPEVIDRINQLRLKKKTRNASDTVLPTFTVQPPPALPLGDSYLRQALKDELPVLNQTLMQLQKSNPRMNTAISMPLKPALW